MKTTTRVSKLKKHNIKDEFRGNDERLVSCIKALIELNDSGSLIPHGIGGHARTLLAACYIRLKNKQKIVNFSKKTIKK